MRIIFPQLSLSPSSTVYFEILILGDEARYSKGIWLGRQSIGERERCESSGLGILREYGEVYAASKVIRKRDVRGKIGGRVKSAAAFAVIKTCSKGMLKDPVCAGRDVFDA